MREGRRREGRRRSEGGREERGREGEGVREGRRRERGEYIMSETVRVWCIIHMCQQEGSISWYSASGTVMADH